MEIKIILPTNSINRLSPMRSGIGKVVSLINESPWVIISEPYPWLAIFLLDKRKKFKKDDVT